MTAASDMAGITITAGEQNTAAAAAGYEDAAGMLTSINNDIAHLKAKCTKLAAAIGAGANATKITAMATALT